MNSNLTLFLGNERFASDQQIILRPSERNRPENVCKIRRVAEVFEGVFVLTGIFIKGVIKYECRRREPLGGFGGMPILKSRGPEMLFSASCTSIFLTRWSVK